MKSDAELLAEAQALDAAYARADAFDKAQLPTRTAYKVYWDNGREACGVFEEIYDSYEAAEEAAENYEVELGWGDIGNEDASCEPIEVQIPIDPEAEEDQYGDLRQAALNHRGQP